MAKYRIPLRVVFYREDELWIAHCLEFDLLGSGDDYRSALLDLSESIRLQVEASIELDNPSNLFRPAPSEYHQMYARGKNIAVGEILVGLPSEIDGLEIEGAEMREFVCDARSDELVLA
jgi:hypothetical protein